MTLRKYKTIQLVLSRFKYCKSIWSISIIVKVCFELYDLHYRKDKIKSRKKIVVWETFRSVDPRRFFLLPFLKFDIIVLYGDFHPCLRASKHKIPSLILYENKWFNSTLRLIRRVSEPLQTLGSSMSMRRN